MIRSSPLNIDGLSKSNEISETLELAQATNVEVRPTETVKQIAVFVIHFLPRNSERKE